MSLYSQRSKNIMRTWVLMLTFFFVVIGAGWSVSWYFGDPTILWFAVMFAILMNVGSYWFSDKIALKTTGARPASREEFFDLYTVTENLSIASGMKMPRIYVINDPAPNAFATGRNEKHAVIAVTTGLLSMMDRSELEGVVAHELAHIKNQDILLMSAVVVLLGMITLLADFALRMSLFGGGRGGDNKGNAFIAIAGIVFIILAPIIAQMIQLAISRRREFLADASGALLTRYPEGLASALEKLGAYSAPMKKANHATAHLFISNPFGRAQAGKFMNKLFMTHPPTEARIAALRGIKV